MLKNIAKKARNVKIIISDVDGVLTDGRIIIGNNGQELKAFHSQDGMGINLAREKGLKFAIITGRVSEVVKMRAEELNIEDVYQNVDDKITILEKIKNKYKITNEEIAYIGDDINDLPILNKVGFAVTVANGVDKVKMAVDYIASRKGGEGAVREIIDLILSCE